MTTDLTKMVKEWTNMDMNDLRRFLLAMAQQIEANEAEIERLKNPEPEKEADGS